MAKDLDRLRFAVGTPDGARSSTWRVWTVRNSADVYVAVRTIAGIEKVSLHESGSYSYSATSQADTSVLQDGGIRHRDIWEKPESDAHGWHRGFAIRFPVRDLRPWPHEEEGGVVFIAPGPTGAAQVSILLGTPDATEFEVNPKENEVGRLRIGGRGGQVVVLVQRNPAFVADSITAQRDSALAQIRTARPDINLPPTARMGLFGSDDATRERFMYDLSCDT